MDFFSTIIGFYGILFKFDGVANVELLDFFNFFIPENYAVVLVLCFKIYFCDESEFAVVFEKGS